jgi:hypothetical protein
MPETIETLVVTDDEMIAMCQSPSWSVLHFERGTDGRYTVKVIRRLQSEPAEHAGSTALQG